MGRCKSLGPLKSFLWYAPEQYPLASWISSGCTIGFGYSGWWHDSCNILCLLTWQVTFYKYVCKLYLNKAVFKIEKGWWIEQCRYLKEEHLLPSNWVCLGVCQVKRHNQAKQQKEEGFIVCSKLGKHQGSFSKQQNWGSFKLKYMHIHEKAWVVCTYSWRGLSWIRHRIGTKVKRVQALIDWSHKAQKMSASSSLRF